jgi:hypothetical protein
LEGVTASKGGNTKPTDQLNEHAKPQWEQGALAIPPQHPDAIDQEERPNLWADKAGENSKG